MNREEFIKLLKDGTTDRNIKIEACEYFIQTYPIKVLELDPFNPFKPKEVYTKLQMQDGSDFKINGGSDASINHAFAMLQTKLKLFEDELGTVSKVDGKAV